MSDHDDFIAWTIREFRANHGRVGGPFAGAPLLLLHTRGARSGLERVSPMMYLADGPRYLVFASKAGADRNPDWYHNLLAHPATIEAGDEHISVIATEMHGPERDRHFAEQARRYPGFADYQRRTRRVIPVVALNPVPADDSRHTDHCCPSTVRPFLPFVVVRVRSDAVPPVADDLVAAAGLLGPGCRAG